LAKKEKDKSPRSVILNTIVELLKSGGCGTFYIKDKNYSIQTYKDVFYTMTEIGPDFTLFFSEKGNLTCCGNELKEESVKEWSDCYYFGIHTEIGNPMFMGTIF